MLLIVIGGIPQYLANEFGQAIEKKVSRDSVKVVWTPYRAGDIHSHAEKLYTKLNSELLTQIDRVDYAAGHLRVLLIAVEIAPGDGDALRKLFFPEVLTCVVNFPSAPSHKAAKSQKSNFVSNVIDRVHEAIERANRIFGALHNEIVSRDNRTPLLLPTGNFSSEHLRPLLERLHGIDSYGKSPEILVAETVKGFERHHSPRKLGDDPRLYFRDDRRIFFKSPGRARHGRRRAEEWKTHRLYCFARAVLRLGVGYHPAFHYDCEFETGGTPAEWKSCHQQSVHLPTARGHANVAPNDFVR